MKTLKDYVSPATSLTMVAVESNLMVSSGVETTIRIDGIQTTVTPFTETTEDYDFSDIDFK